MNQPESIEDAEQQLIQALAADAEKHGNRCRVCKRGVPDGEGTISLMGKGLRCSDPACRRLELEQRK